MTEFVLVSCSKSKLSGTHRAGDIYEPSDIFGKRRAFAKRRGVHWGVLSAKHGYLRSWEAVENYDRHISDRTPVWGAFVLTDLLADLEYYDVGQVTVLAGKRYVDPLVAELEARGYDVLDYNRGLRPGERKRALKEANAPGEQETLVTDGGEDVGRGDNHGGRWDRAPYEPEDLIDEYGLSDGHSSAGRLEVTCPGCGKEWYPLASCCVKRGSRTSSPFCPGCGVDFRADSEDVATVTSATVRATTGLTSLALSAAARVVPGLWVEGETTLYREVDDGE